jgi:hypothetical protein
VLVAVVALRGRSRHAVFKAFEHLEFRRTGDHVLVELREPSVIGFQSGQGFPDHSILLSQGILGQALDIAKDMADRVMVFGGVSVSVVPK